ncbi:hypothetical protein [Streptomyces sp. NPDC048142]|uniref:hypothetical protein n=1 Tax=Streptomyces sp. NPDC048142 TaxID=3365501 RepID=UPI0037167703
MNTTTPREWHVIFPNRMIVMIRRPGQPDMLGMLAYDVIRRDGSKVIWLPEPDGTVPDKPMPTTVTREQIKTGEVEIYGPSLTPKTDFPNAVHGPFDGRLSDYATRGVWCEERGWVVLPEKPTDPREQLALAEIELDAAVFSWEDALLSWDEDDEDFTDVKAGAHNEIALAARAVYQAKRQLRG